MRGCWSVVRGDPVRAPVSFGPWSRASCDELVPWATSTLRVESPAVWASPVNALAAACSEAVLRPAVFDRLSPTNKLVVVAAARRLLSCVQHRFDRLSPAELLPNDLFLRQFRSLYGTPSLLAAICDAAAAAMPDSGPVAGSSAGVVELVERALREGRLVCGDDLELCVERNAAFAADAAVPSAAELSDDLNGCDMHAFLCAFAGCFGRS